MFDVSGTLYDDPNSIYVFEDGFYIPWDNMHPNNFLGGYSAMPYLDVVPPKGVDLKEFAKQFAEENKDNFPEDPWKGDPDI